jgi:hypothetical protein
LPGSPFEAASQLIEITQDRFSRMGHDSQEAQTMGQTDARPDRLLAPGKFGRHAARFDHPPDRDRAQAESQSAIKTDA